MMTSRVPHPDEYTPLVARAYGMFCEGKNTKSIALKLAVPEAAALRMVTMGRCYRLNLPMPFEPIKLKVVR